MPSCEDGKTLLRWSARTFKFHRMARVRKIQRKPQGGKNYFVVDACFLANKYIPLKIVPPNRPADQKAILHCREWWSEIDQQLKVGAARVYVPDVCIAETFKVLASKYYKKAKWFRTAQEMNNARLRFRNDIVVPRRVLTAQKRAIRFHDIPTSRDIVIAVDRFYELFMKYQKNVSIVDLIIVAGAKYLMDFYDIPRDRLHIITLDRDLVEGIETIQELPNAYNPTRARDAVAKIFS